MSSMNKKGRVGWRDATLADTPEVVVTHVP
jgi:hypothetical protein